MRSAVAQTMKEADRRDMIELSLPERIAVAEQLAEEGIALLVSMEKIDRNEAIRRIERSHKAGRRPSVLNEE